MPEDLECPNCILRLVREAREWGRSYKFKSCADVNVVPYDVRITHNTILDKLKVINKALIISLINVKIILVL